jgi:hypothetical protein
MTNGVKRVTQVNIELYLAKGKRKKFNFSKDIQQDVSLQLVLLSIAG